MKPIVTFPKGSITAKDKLALCKAGYVPIETDSTLTVTQSVSQVIGGDELFRCAIRALNKAAYATDQARFLTEVAKSIEPSKKTD